VQFPEQSAAQVLAALGRFERDPARFAPQACRENAQRFDRAVFRRRFGELVRQAQAA
jgi:ribosomal protein S4